MKPIIGIILRNNISDSGHQIGIIYEKLNDAIINSGGIPIAIFNKDIDNYLDICSGFILQGGDNFDPLNFEIIKLLRENDIPLLGICQGMQEMAYTYNGLIKEVTNHKDTKHIINIKKDTLLYKIVGKPKLKVNSRHHESIIKTDLTVSAKSNDLIIEAVEDKQNKFFLGLQYHPESMYNNDKNAKKIFDYFVKICHDNESRK